MNKTVVLISLTCNLFFFAYYLKEQTDFFKKLILIRFRKFNIKKGQLVFSESMVSQYEVGTVVKILNDNKVVVYLKTSNIIRVCNIVEDFLLKTTKEFYVGMRVLYCLNGVKIHCKIKEIWEDGLIELDMIDLEVKGMTCFTGVEMIEPMIG